jgi:sRNA-binding carbon storage regulator CsrA
MLVLTLTEGDYIQIGDDIRVHFDYKPSDDELSVGIDAPGEHKILRGKLYEEANPHKRDTGIPHRRNRNRRRAG